MKRTSHFHDFPYDRWPAPSELKPYFTPDRWTCGEVSHGSDSFGFTVLGLDGVEGAPYGASPSRASLHLVGNPRLGVTLQYDRWRKQLGIKEYYVSRGNDARLLIFFRNLHDDLYSCGLFVPFEQAWLATKQFLESDGELPSAIEWVDPKTLPREAFPLP